MFLNKHKLTILSLSLAGLICLSGCSDYSLAKNEKPNLINISETDSRILITQYINQTLGKTAQINSQLLIYLEDTVKPTKEMKESLIQSVQSTKTENSRILEELSLKQVSIQSQTRKENVVGLMKDLDKTYDEILTSLEKNDFDSLKTKQTSMNSIIEQLQASS